MLHVETTRAERWLPDRAVYMGVSAIDVKPLRYVGLGRHTRGLQADDALEVSYTVEAEIRSAL